jgi:hypothetical protein
MAFLTYILVPGLYSVEITALTQVTHQGDVEITKHPVEIGANISDHARLKPETVTLAGIVSDTSVGKATTKRVITADGFDFTSNVAEDVPTGTAGASEEAYARLLQIKNARQFVWVVTELRTYKNMMLTSLSVPREVTTGDSLRFTAVFEEIKLSQVQSRDVKVARTTGKDKVKTGAQATPKGSGDDDNRSILHRGAHDNDTGRAVLNLLSPPGSTNRPR